LRRILFPTAVAGALTVLLFGIERKPPVIAVGEVPIAFWAWQTNAPVQSDVDKAIQATNAKFLFVRAGQFDLSDKGVKRIRRVTGTLPKRIELHLVYNGTRDFLAGWHRVDMDALADEIGATYFADRDRVRVDGAEVRGVQLDFDIPTRLLPEYAGLLRTLRSRLPTGTELSITGLPTWLEADEIELVLDEIDFWIPQFYGSKVPDHAEKRIPISSPAEVERTIKKVRRLNKPFFAGLASYGYAILYGADGSLIELRGDIDPADAAAVSSLRLVERRPFAETGAESSVRYAYRATRDVVLSGLVVRKDETLVFDVPTAGLLRSSAKVVRENGGKNLRGICLFRLPSDADPTTLTVDEIAAAIADTQTHGASDITVTRYDGDHVVVSAAAKGNASSIIADGAFAVDVIVPVGTLAAISKLDRFDSYETLCGDVRTSSPQPCGTARASILRLKASSWRPGSRASATIRFKQPGTAIPSVVVTMYLDDGRVEKTPFEY
jgi:hypothetical protein